MKENQKNKKKRITKPFATLAIEERKYVQESTNIGEPSEEAIKRAKDWVDFNEK